MSPVRKAYYILRYLGPRIVWLRASVYLRASLGRTRGVFRARPWEQIALNEITYSGTPTDAEGYAQYKRANPPPFLFPLGQPPAVPPELRGVGAERQPVFAERLTLLAEGRCVYFFRTPAPAPVDWYTNPFDGQRAARDRVWTEIPDYLREQGDPRMLWEPARAAWAIDLARARSHGFDIDAPALFWRWVDSFMDACPPFQGFHWKCGQESAVRFIALALGFWSLANDVATTPQRWQQFARLAWATGYRIAQHIHYAISQKNNHAISEACGLLLVSQLFPEFRGADTWQRTGRHVLARELRRQIYADGSYVQHSPNYQRVMLAGAILALRLAELRGQPFERDLYARLARCSEFLFQMMEPQSGRVPQHGNNDGAHVLPLNECDFLDFRPILQATHYLVHRTRGLPAGPWDEDLVWLFGPAALRRPLVLRPPACSRAFVDGGYYTLRQGQSWAMLRCHSYRDRPAHCDQLHLDLWYRGQNVLADCGTYKYYVPARPDVEYYFKSTAAHNTAEVDGTAPMELVSRFLWFPWPRGKVRRFGALAAGGVCFEGEHSGYDRAPWHVLHRRSLVGLSGDLWVVVDDLIGAGTRTAVLRWHLLDAPYEFNARGPEVVLHTPAGALHLSIWAARLSPTGAQVIRGRDDPGQVQGFAAPYYGERRPIPTFEVAYRAPLPIRMVTCVCPEKAQARVVEELGDRQHWEVAAGARTLRLDLGLPIRGGQPTLLDCAPRSHDSNRLNATPVLTGRAP